MMRLTCVVLTGLFVFAPAAPAQVDPVTVQEAIRKGAEYLKKFQPGKGAHSGISHHAAGLASLVGMALLEAGVPHTDPTVAGIVEFVRVSAYQQTQTYDVSLMIVFLDRLNDPADIPLIQLLGCRLLAGQNAGGGWGYNTWNTSPDEARVQAAVGVKDPKVIQPQPRPDPNAPPPTPPRLHPEAEKIYRAVRSGARTGGASVAVDFGGGDNSNTQFAIVGLWVAQRRGVPGRAAIQQIDTRFMRSQSPTDHGWGYSGHGGGSTPSMTCAGLLGLAVAAAADAGKLPADRLDLNSAVAKAQQKKPEDDDPFFNPPDGPGGGDPDAPPDDEEQEEKQEVLKKGTNAFREAAIKRGLEAIGRLLKGNLGQAGITAAGMAGNGWGGINDLYFYWSLERVAVAFGLDTIGDVDWYSWGASRILPSQREDGSWPGNYADEANTAFAILFLAKSNFVTDLSARIKGKVKDPGAAELRGTRGGPLAMSPEGSVEAVRVPGADDPKKTTPQGPGDIARIQEQTAAEKVAEELLTAKDSEWLKRLQIAKDRKGGHNTAGLVLAAARLDGKRQYQVREALADRLTRMTTDTLRRYLTDRDPELRRAASLAAAMKDDKALVRDLIDRITDIDEFVVRAARAGLKSLTGRDFGPPPEASDEQKMQAQKEWLTWFALEGRGR